MMSPTRAQRPSPAANDVLALDALRPAPPPYAAWSAGPQASTLDLIERGRGPDGPARIGARPSAEAPPPIRGRAHAPGQSRGVRCAAAVGALVGCGVPCAAGIAFLVPVASFVNPTGERALGYAAPLLGAGLTIGLGMGLVVGKQLGEACCGLRRRPLGPST